MGVSMNTQIIIETQLPGSVIKVNVVKQNKTKSSQNVKRAKKFSWSFFHPLKYFL